MRFNFGQTHYGESLRDADNIGLFLDECTQKFNRNYWGFADKQQWKDNKIALFEGKGEIKAQYKNEDGLIIHIINFDVLDTKHTLFCTQEDLDEGAYEKITGMIEKKLSAKKKRIGFFA